jgi:predicted ATPase/DNA-binding CsgD family transcriptional regulator
MRTATPLSPLPADVTSFVGRRSEIREVRWLLSVGRLVTLTGIGGVGKTRLALRVARETERAFEDGVFLVELAPLQDPALLPHTVSDALAVPERSAREPVTVLADYLRGRRILLVLDNCEHVLEAAADLADRVLRAAPGVRILATSRQVLRMAGEHVYRVPPLPTPDPDQPMERGTATQYPSVSLFADRSAAVVPGFVLTPENEPAVIRLCQRLEGIPLAIELASVRLRVLALDDLANQLDDRFRLLRDGNRNLPRRHQTLEALVEWSHDLCTPAERLLWARAAVFAGGFTVEALKEVCADEALAASAILDALAGLVDKSIVIREEHGSFVRFRMLETIQAYGRARLVGTGDESVLRGRHRDWCLQLVTAAGDAWFGPLQREWAIRLQLEQANLRNALEYCLSVPGEARVGLRMAAVPWLWLALGLLPEGRLWVERALAADVEPTPERAWALASAGFIAVFQGDEAAAPLAEEARQLAVRLGDPAALALATHVLGTREFLGTDLARGVPRLLDARQRYADAGVTGLYPNTLRLSLATTYLLLGDVDKAAQVAEELYQRCEEVGESWLFSYALLLRGFVALTRGDLGRAEHDLCEALKITRFFHDTFGSALVLDLLASSAVASGSPERAATLLGAAGQLWPAVGIPQFGSPHLIARREKDEQTARKQMGNAAFDAAVAQGGALTIEQTFAIALREASPPAASPTAARTRRSDEELTRREQEVAELVAEGMPNREIAARLVISTRTAEAHVAHILSKLGFTSRTQIATWVANRQAGRTPSGN